MIMFPVIAAITKKWISKSTQYLSYLKASERFSFDGETVFARQLLNEAKKLNEEYPYRNQEMIKVDFLSTEAQILMHEGKLEEAAKLYSDWINRFPKVFGKSLAGNSYRIAGIAQASAGNYDLAIDYLEKAIKAFEVRRSSFEVRSRGGFLSGLIASTYWGLIRSYGARYLEQENEQDFKDAMRSEQMLRARQFGELLGIDNKGITGFDDATFKLGPDELLLDYVLTDNAIILFAVSSDRHDIFMLPYEPKKLNDALRRVKSNLSSIGNYDGTVQDLQVISNLVLGPVRDKLAKGKKIIVIPDGYLNSIPLTVLSRSSDQYIPLIMEHEVSMTPSISYFVRQRKDREIIATDKLFALADPMYGSRSVPETHTDETEAFYKRAVTSFNLFAPLPETKTEVENIAHLFNPENVSFLTGTSATESNVKSFDLSTYRYLHFATHGVLGNQIPGVYEPALVLAEDNKGQDGFLTMSEVEDLRLNSELTVLSV